MRKKDGGFRMPNPAVVVGRRCVVVNIPDDVVHRANFWGALNELARASNYDADRLSDSYAAAEMWLQVLEESRLLECGGGSMSCDDVLNCLDGVPEWIEITQPPDEVGLSTQEIQDLSNASASDRALQYNGTPASMLNSVNDNAVRWLNNLAIEEAVTAWVVACAEAKLTQIRQVEGLRFIAILLLPFAKYLGHGGWLLKQEGWSFLSFTTYGTYGYAEMYDALQDRENIRYTVGAIMSSMNHSATRDINLLNFQEMHLTGDASRWAYGDVPMIRNWLRDEILNHPINSEKNYLLLLQAIHTANKHKVVDGDPMWRAWLDTWIMYRGKNYSTVGVSMIEGTVNSTVGFNYAPSGQYSRLTFALNTPVKSKLDSFLLQLRSGTPAGRTSNVKIKNAGAIVAQNTWGGFVTSDSYTNIGAVEYDGIVYTAEVNWGNGNTAPAWDNNGHVRLIGSGSPPVGYWTPD